MTTALALYLGMSPVVFWPYAAALAVCLIGRFAIRHDVSQARGWDKLRVLSRLWYAVPLAAFAGEHLSAGKFVMMGVPSYMPWRLFWAYFVGVALLAAALSIVTKVQIRCSGALLGVMIFLFVGMLHIPRVAANLHDRFAWAVAVRDCCFAAAAWVLAASQGKEAPASSKIIQFGCFLIGITLVFFGVEHFLHPEGLPVVPLERLTPIWMPARRLIDYLTGAILIVTGASVLLRRKPRSAATLLGTTILVLVALVYLPVLIASASDPSPGNKIEALNYFMDTLMFGGTVLVLANALPRETMSP